MELSDFHFDLPEELIAQNPARERGTSRLFVLDRKTGTYTHSDIARIADFIPAGSVLVFNDSKVIKARLYAKTETGGTIELLLVRKITDTVWNVMATRSKRLKPGKRLEMPAGVSAVILETQNEFRVVEFSEPVGEAYMERYGHIPLPPYIRREDTLSDSERYQTIYAKTAGSIAAPTAGLHFTTPILEALKSKGVSIVFVTLHVGLGTFLPVRVQNIFEHTMHEETYSISTESSDTINAALAEGRKVIPVGTTSLRTLESAWDGEKVPAGRSSTQLFIYPGFAFHVASSLFTNFHTPESTLLMLVSAFAGREAILKAYNEAISQKYRFFSYGDAMLIL